MILSGMVKAAVVAIAVAPSTILLTSPGNSPSLSLTQYRPDCVDGKYTVEPPKRGHFGNGTFVLSSEVVLFSEVV